jgi:hypothetical protein
MKKSKNTSNINKCPNCKHTVDNVTSWDDKFEGKRNLEYHCDKCGCEFVKFVSINKINNGVKKTFNPIKMVTFSNKTKRGAYT